MSLFKNKILPYLIYPATMVISVLLYLFLIDTNLHLILKAYIPLTVAVLSVLFFEYSTPYRKEWVADRNDVKHDMAFLIFTQLLFSKFLTFLTAYLILNGIDRLDFPTKGFWPEQLPVVVQGLLMVLIIDFFRYWLHWACHNTTILWRLHAIHHSPKKLYSLNVGRFHPIERSLQFLIDTLPFMLIGVSAEVLGMYYLFFSINGFFQHCNINLRYGFLNYIVSSAELHRWHHSKKIQESNSNYSNTTIIWDVLFRTRFLPADKSVGQLGLINPDYPMDFRSQMKTPFISTIDKRPSPLLSHKEILINFFLMMRMTWLKYSLYLPLKKASNHPGIIQEKLLLGLMRRNKDTVFGRKYRFNEIDSYQKFKELIPVQSYEDLRPYIEEQEAKKTLSLTQDSPVMYNQTSGTTGAPKYIPILSSTLSNIKRSQNIFSYVQYKAQPDGFKGKLLGLVSPAIEGHLLSGSAYGSASGLVYKNMPRIAQTKYVIPYEVFEIRDYQIKYYIILRLALAEKNITYLGSANPSTFLKLLEVIKIHRNDFIEDISNGTVKYIETINTTIASKIKKKIKPNKERAEELAKIFMDSNGNIGFSAIWPYLKIVSTWTGGSCAMALNGLKNKFPKEAKIMELGYLSSELRGSITINDETNEGLPTLQDNFFEFVEKDKWEKNAQDFLTLNQIVPGKEYYIFVTTDAGLYRYNMNDIISVTSLFQKTPTIKFIQKGKGVVNITGEKLYESQVLSAMSLTEQSYKFNTVFYQVLGDEDKCCYELFLEADLPQHINLKELQNSIDDNICNLNIEYKAKRSSGRINCLQLYLIQPGTFELYKRFCLEKGMREGQFKTVALLNKKDFHFSFVNHLKA